MAAIVQGGNPVHPVLILQNGEKIDVFEWCSRPPSIEIRTSMDGAAAIEPGDRLVLSVPIKRDTDRHQAKFQAQFQVHIDVVDLEFRTLDSGMAVLEIKTIVAPSVMLDDSGSAADLLVLATWLEELGEHKKAAECRAVAKKKDPKLDQFVRELLS